MYYPICFLMPNAGPCIKAAPQPSGVFSSPSSNNEPMLAASSPTPTPTPTSLSPARLAEEKSVSSYKAMLRSIYSSRERQSSLSDFWATAMPQPTSVETAHENTSQSNKASATALEQDSREKELDTSPMSIPQLMFLSAVACVGAVAHVLF